MMNRLLSRVVAPGAFRASTLQRLLNWYPPYVGAGIRVAEISNDWLYARVVLPLRWYNRNYVGVHFGGSLYAMCDPMYMLLLMNLLGRDFIVWDKAGSIEYVKPGTGRLSAEFRLDSNLVESLKELRPNEKRVFDLAVDVRNEAGEVVARVVKTEYVRRKPGKQPVAQSK